MELLGLILPVFAIILTGWLFRSLRILSETTAHELINYVFYVAAPAILILSIGMIPFQKIWDWGFFGVFGLSILVAFLFLLWLFQAAGKHSFNACVLYALSGSMSNAGFIGLPILFAIFGHRGILTGALSLVVVIILFAIAIFLLEIHSHTHTSKMHCLLKALFGLIKNPLIIGVIIGIILSVSEVKVNDGVRRYFRILANTLAGTALFAIGMQVHFKHFFRNLKEIFGISLVKLVFLPVVVFFLVKAFNIQPIWDIAAVLMSALPSAKSCALIAGIYLKDSEHDSSHRISEVISATTLLSIITLIIWLFVLAHHYPIEFKAAASPYYQAHVLQELK